jgi:hypothetical protein
VIRETGAGLLYEDLDDLVEKLRGPALPAARAAMWEQRRRFTFEPYVPALDQVLRRA